MALKMNIKAAAITSIGWNVWLVAATRANDIPPSSTNDIASLPGVLTVASLIAYRIRTGTRMQTLSCCESVVESSISSPSSGVSMSPSTFKCADCPELWAMAVLEYGKDCPLMPSVGLLSAHMF